MGLLASLIYVFVPQSGGTLDGLVYLIHQSCGLLASLIYVFVPQSGGTLDDLVYLMHQSCVADGIPVLENTFEKRCVGARSNKALKFRFFE